MSGRLHDLVPIYCNVQVTLTAYDYLYVEVSEYGVASVLGKQIAIHTYGGAYAGA